MANYPDNDILSEDADVDLGYALHLLVQSQKLVKVAPDSWQAKPTRDNVRQYGLALIDEVLEYCRELGYKDWKPVPQHDPERIADEMADILAFVGILLAYGMELGGVSALQFAQAYRNKTVVNVNRAAGLVEGYGSLMVQADKLLGPRALKYGYYYNVVDGGLDYTALLEGYDSELELFHFREIIGGSTIRLHQGGSWEAREVGGAKVGGANHEPAAARAD